MTIDALSGGNDSGSVTGSVATTAPSADLRPAQLGAAQFAAQGLCVVIGCNQDAVAIIGKPTEWGAWEYQVCADHQDQAARGAWIDDQPDGRSIVLRL